MKKAMIFTIYLLRVLGKERKMTSKTLTHLEQCNRELRYDVFFEKFNGGLIRDDEKAFYSNLMYAIYNCCPKFDKNPQPLEFFEKEYDELENNEQAKKEIYNTYETMAMISSWLNYKQIYRFDEDTMELLLDSECKDMTFEELKKLKLPFECFSIENEIEYEGKIIDTIFFNRLFNEDTDEMLLMVYGVAKGEGFQLLKLNIGLENDKNDEKSLFKELDERCMPQAVDFFKKVMNLVLYLCQPKVEVIKERKSKAISNPNKDKKEKIKHFYKVDYNSDFVGLRLGNAIRNYKVRYTGEKSENDEIRSKRVVKPHTRAGHFQGYWTGKGRTNLITKYIEPIFVLGGCKEATLHSVKK